MTPLDVRLLKINGTNKHRACSHNIRQGTQETTGSRKISVLLAWGLAEIIETGLNNLVSLLELTNYQTRLPLIGNRNKHN